MIELARVVKAQEQTVAGKLHHLTLEVMDAGKKKLYEAKVWVKPWLNFKELQEFKHVEDVPTFTSSDLGVKQGSSLFYVNVNYGVLLNLINSLEFCINQLNTTLRLVMNNVILGDIGLCQGCN